MKRFVIASILIVAAAPILAQNESELVGLETIVGAIEQLEGKSDAKCHASATRLENFMYGTPLTFDAREAKVELQKTLILEVWQKASAKARETGKSRIDAELIGHYLDDVLDVELTDEGDFHVRVPGQPETLVLTARDVRQYSSIAYALRAILAVQQEALLSPELQLVPLEQEAIDAIKKTVDLRTLATLNLSDRAARAANEQEVNAGSFTRSWKSLSRVETSRSEIRLASDEVAPGQVLRKIVDQKLASYAKYNDIRDPLFFSNIRAFFARHPWPKDSAKVREITREFSSVNMNIAAEWILRAQKKADAEGSPLIRESHIREVFEETAPFEVNQYEDITFFADLGRDKRLRIESYDADSFRDSGLHFQLLKQVIDSPDFPLTKDFDPFAAEYLAEGVAQMGVLTFRVAGMIAKEKGAPELAPEHIAEAQERIASLMREELQAPKSSSAPGATLTSARVKSVPVSGNYFDEVTAQTGIDYVHRSSDWLSRFIRSFLYSVRAPDAPNPRKGEAAHDAAPAFSGSGIAADDVDGDGDVDVLFVGGLGNRLYLNDGSGRFSDATERAGLDFLGSDGKPGEPRQPIIADLDNDGDQDILITYVDEDHRVYRNNGDGTFEDVSAEAGLGGDGLVGAAATVFDFDRDGLLDVYIGYYGNYVEGVGPNLARVNNNATPNKLFHNEGEMKFAEVEGSGAENTGWSQAVAAVDFNGDGWQDLIVGNDFGMNAYYRNNGDGTFTDVTVEIGTDIPTNAMNVGTADLNRDGLPEVYISNILTLVKDEKYVLPTEETRMKLNPKKLATMRIVSANHLFRSASEKGRLDHYLLSDEIDRADTGWAWDADFFDFDNDGDDDLYCVNGLNEYKFYDAEFNVETAEGKRQTIVFSVHDQEKNVFFVNEDGRLRDRSGQSGADFSGNSRAAAYLDYDLDGDLDIVVNNFHEPARFFRNNAERLGRNWLKIRLVGDVESGSNRDAIGAVLEVRPENGPAIWRTVQGGTGYLSHHPKEQHVGLANAERADVTILWPNGERQTIRGLRANERYVIDQTGKIVPPVEPEPESVARTID